MELYVLVDEILLIARHRETREMAVFKDMNMLERHKHEYMLPIKNYKVVKMVLSEVIELEGQGWG